MQLKNKKASELSSHLAPVFTLAIIFALLLIALLLSVALLSYTSADPAWSHNNGDTINNNLGVVGAWYSDLSFSLIGKLSYLLPLALLALAVHAWLEKGFDKEVLSWRLVMLLTAILSGCVLWARHDPASINTVAKTGGGALGVWLFEGLKTSVKSEPVIMSFSLVIFVVSISLLFNIPWMRIAEWLGKGITTILGNLLAGFGISQEKSTRPQNTIRQNDTDNDSQVLQEKIKQLNQMASEPKETPEKKKPQFTIDRYQPETADETLPDFSDTDKPQRPKPWSLAKARAAAKESNSASKLTSNLASATNHSVSKTATGDSVNPSAVESAPPVTSVNKTRKNTGTKAEPNFFNFDHEAHEADTTSYNDNPVNNTSPAHAASVPDSIPETQEQPSLVDYLATVTPPKSSPSQQQPAASLTEGKEALNITRPTVNEAEVKVDEADKAKPLTPHLAASRSAAASIERIGPIEPSEALIKSWADEPASSPTAAADNSKSVLQPLEMPSLGINPTRDVAATSPQPDMSEAITPHAPEIKPVDFSGLTGTNDINQTLESGHIASPAASVPEPAKPAPEPQTASSMPASQATIGKVYQPEILEPQVQTPYQLPSIDLLDNPQPQINAYTEDTLAEMATVLENTLKQFNIKAIVMHVSPGPVITRFELDLAPGIQAKKITNLSQDLARALAVSRVRVEEVIPGSSYVGLEVPNKQRQIVYFKDVVRSRAFQESTSPLTVSLGSDTSGKPVVADLMKMPHVLVAGTTGSGKSVCINVMLLSMLYKASPKDLRLIMVDPKMLEMSMYEDIPHLLTPVITDMNEAENALTWAVGEMERRYQLMAALKVRKIDAFNQQVDEANARGEPIKDPLWEPNEQVGYTHHPHLERLPFIVIVIDELADMMMVVGKQVEQLIARLTQKARAAGIHVVLATQRPSTDVLTGLIKANVPTRIAFQVSSGTDSRVIIDSVGAEKLLGHGDMLYVPPGVSHPKRLHGAFVGDAETDRITDYLRSTGEPDYVDGITVKQAPETLGAFGAAEAADAKEDADPLYGEAVAIVLQTGKASISSVQRQLRIGYNRAARMIEDMQEQGIVSEPVNGVRKVLAAPPPAKDN